MNPLEGIRVVDFSRAMAGPYCTMILGDLGADVIKVERPDGGDDSRGWGPPFADGAGQLSAYFISANRNKRSLTLDLKTTNGLQAAKGLLERCDVLVENFRTGVMERFGLGYSQAEKVNPGIIYCSISGYGRSGPNAHLPGYDVVMQAEGGLMSITGPKGGPPFRTGIPIIDISSGMFAATAILGALRARDQIDEGQLIEVSLLETSAALLSNVASNYLVGGQLPKRFGNDHPNLAPYGVQQGRDGWFVLGVANQSQWHKLCQVLDQPDLQQDPLFATNEERVNHRSQLDDILADIFRQQPVGDWLADLRQAGIPCGPINDVEQVFNHPQAEARQLTLAIPHPEFGPLKTPGLPYSFSKTPADIRLPPPKLGEHTISILSEWLGYSQDEAERLAQQHPGAET